MRRLSDAQLFNFEGPIGAALDVDVGVLLLAAPGGVQLVAQAQQHVRCGLRGARGWSQNSYRECANDRRDCATRTGYLIFSTRQANVRYIHRWGEKVSRLGYLIGTSTIFSTVVATEFAIDP